MKRVLQKHEKGCVPASFAMVLDITYEDALKLFPGRKKTWDKRGAFPEEKFAALGRAGVIFTTKYGPSNILNSKYNCIVSLQYRHCRHSVVWDAKKQRILDPWVNNHHIDSDRKRHRNLKDYLDHIDYYIEIRKIQ